MNKYFVVLIGFLIMANMTFANEILPQLDERMRQVDSLVCVGLDPDPVKIPLSIMNCVKRAEDGVLSFLSQVVDITHPHVCCYKIQKAFFDQFDQGHCLLKNIVSYIHETYPGIPVFVDCKIGDTDNTMQTYMHILFNQMHIDGVVINPYMGDDVLEPFQKDPQKVAIVLVQTSNPNGKVVQELKLANGRMLWEEMLDLTVTRWNQNKNLILVLSSNTSMNNYTHIRELIPQDMPILLAGIGSQGGNPAILKQLLNDNQRGVFVNSSRAILYPYSPENRLWKDEVLKAAVALKMHLNQIRYGD
jgi:orotidine-5'-phosphate decarboxylase